MRSTSLLLPHLNDLAERAGRGGEAWVAGHFLTPAEATQAQAAYRNRRDVMLLLDGGFAAAERVVPIFLPPGSGEYPQAEVLAALEFRFRPQDTVGHRDMLGAALALGLQRTALGDIVLEPGRAVLLCLRRMAPFLLEQLQTAGRIGLRGSEIPLDALPQAEKSYREERHTVASPRVDALLAEAFHCSRGTAEEWLRAGLVQLSHAECTNGAKQAQQGDLLSVRGKGRCKLLALGGESKKGRIWVTFGFEG
jgi:RNA-binding protein YlmH